MAELSKDIIGRKLDSYSITVERGKIREFCKAIGETNPIYFDSEAARAAGYADTPAPPTFQTTFMFWGYPKIWDDMSSVGIDIQRLLHMKEDYVYHKPLYPGMVITTQPEISDVKIGKMNMVTFRSVFRDEKNEPVIEAEMAIVIRPEGT